MFYRTLVVYCWKMTTFVIILSRIFYVSRYILSLVNRFNEMKIYFISNVKARLCVKTQERLDPPNKSYGSVDLTLT